MLIGRGDDSNNVYLVDFGLCVQYLRGSEKEHKEYKPDPKKAHDGTIEYCSRDAHIGVTGRRSDLEVVGYNLLHWVTGRLPWLDRLASVTRVQEAKNQFMDNLGKNVADAPGPIRDFLKVGLCSNTSFKVLSFSL